MTTATTIAKITAAEKATDFIGRILSTTAMAGIAATIFCSGANAQSLHRPVIWEREVTCEYHRAENTGSITVGGKTAQIVRPAGDRCVTEVTGHHTLGLDGSYHYFQDGKSVQR